MTTSSASVPASLPAFFPAIKPIPSLPATAIGHRQLSSLPSEPSIVMNTAKILASETGASRRHPDNAAHQAAPTRQPGQARQLRRLRTGSSTVVAALFAALVVAGCSKPVSVATAATPAAGELATPTDPDVVIAQADLAAQLKVAPVNLQPIGENLRVPGRVAFDEQQLARIGASVAGRVTRLFVAPGQQVEAGTVLADVHSSELGAAQLAYQKALAQRELQASALARARQLLAADVIGTAELQRRQSELAVASAEVRTAGDLLRMMGVPPERVSERQSNGLSAVSPVIAPMAGTVVERKVAQGQVVQPGDELFAVADLSRVWVIGEVPESVAAQVRAGQTVEIHAGLPGGPLVATLDWVSDIVDPQSRTVTVRTSLENRERNLRPAMLTALVIRTQATERLAVPSSAVVKEGNRDYVFLQRGQREFRLTPVKLGAEANGLRPVLEGLEAGQPVVVDGAFHLNNEHKRAELEGA